MPRFHPRRPSAAMTVAVLALVVAMGGTGYAALKLPKNSVGARQLKRAAVTRAKLRGNAVTGAKVKDRSLTGADIDFKRLPTVPSAANAAHADNADALGGRSATSYLLACPANTVLRAGLCFETAERQPAALTEAMIACADADRRLPTQGELAAYERHLTSQPPLEWTDSQYYGPGASNSLNNRGALWTFSNGGYSSSAGEPAGNPYPFRCVTGPSN